MTNSDTRNTCAGSPRNVLVRYGMYSLATSMPQSDAPHRDGSALKYVAREFQQLRLKLRIFWRPMATARFATRNSEE